MRGGREGIYRKDAEKKKENKGWLHQHKLFISMTSERW